MSLLAVAGLFHRTVEVIEQRGWCSGTFVTRAGRVCLIAALGEAAGAWVDPGGSPQVVWDNAPVGSGVVFDQAVEALTLIVQTLPSMWNDMHGRTVDEVKALLLRAAEEAERRGD